MDGAYFPEEAILRTPPASVSAEQAVLGGVMLAPEALWRVADLLTEQDFYRRDHGLIWKAINELADKRKPFDAVTLGDWFEAQGLSEQVGGGAYLVELASTTPSAANIVAYAEIVADMALRRRLIEAGTEIVSAGYARDGGEVEDALADAQSRVAGLMPKQRGGLQPSADSLKDWFHDLQRRAESPDRLTGVPTPWSKFNAATHGLQKGELTIIAGRPSMGKSIMGLNAALCAAMRGLRVAFFSLEMTRNQIHRRNIASLMDVPHDWLLAPHKEEDHWAKVTAAVRELQQADLYVDDTADLSLVQFMARARTMHLKQPIDLLVVDHIHDFRVDARLARFEYGRIAQGVKTLAKEFNCPGVALAQLSRALATRQDKRPVMSDLRESGELEQKGDLIVFLHREDYYDQATHLQGVVEVIIAKGRDIEAGKTIYLKNDFAHMAMRDWEGHVPSAPVSEPRRRPFGRRPVEGNDS